MCECLIRVYTYYSVVHFTLTIALYNICCGSHGCCNRSRVSAASVRLLAASHRSPETPPTLRRAAPPIHPSAAGHLRIRVLDGSHTRDINADYNNMCNRISQELSQSDVSLSSPRQGLIVVSQLQRVGPFEENWVVEAGEIHLARKTKKHPAITFTTDLNSF
ncbi:hypothetical protein ACJJTC_011183 [Scirpophaga incertulas]